MEIQKIVAEKNIDGVRIRMEIPLRVSESLDPEEEEAFRLVYEPTIERLAYYMVAATNLGEIGIRIALPVIEKHIEQAAEEMLLAVRGMRVADADKNAYAYTG